MIFKWVGSFGQDVPVKLVIFPYFLYRGIHLEHDIPEIIRQCQLQLSNSLTLTMASPVLDHPTLAQVFAERSREAVPIKTQHHAKKTQTPRNFSTQAII